MPLFPEPCASGSDWASVLVLLYCLGKSVVAEVYPSWWTRRFPREDSDDVPTPLRLGCNGQTAMGHWTAFSVRRGRWRSAVSPELRDGFWGWCKPATTSD